MTKKTTRKKHIRNLGDTERITCGILLILSLATLVGGMYFYLVGFHNTDLGYNLRYVNSEYDLDLWDKNSNDEYWTAEEMYMTGLDQIQYSIVVIMVSMFGLGVVFTKVVDTHG